MQCQFIDNHLSFNQEQKIPSYSFCICQQVISMQSHQITAYDLPIFERYWTLIDELIMLEGLELFGAENWAKVSEYFRGKFKPQEIRDHYYRVFGNHTQQSNENDYLPTDDKWLINLGEGYNIFDLALKKDEKRRAQENVNRQIQDRQFDEFVSLRTKREGIPQGFQYNEHSGKFGFPYNMEQAEALIACLDFNKGDGPEVKQRKMNVLKEYNERIREREIVHKEVLDRNLFSFLLNYERKQKVANAKREEEKKRQSESSFQIDSSQQSVKQQSVKDKKMVKLEMNGKIDQFFDQQNKEREAVVEKRSDQHQQKQRAQIESVIKKQVQSLKNNKSSKKFKKGERANISFLFSLKRSSNNTQLPDNLYLICNKMKKFDHGEELKKMLVDYMNLSEELSEVKSELLR